MRKKIILTLFCSVCLIFVLTAGSLMAASTKPTPGVIELRLSHNTTTKAPLHLVLDKWAKKVEEQTQGRVKITIYPAESLHSLKDAYPSTIGGICDIAFAAIAYEPVRWGLNNVLNQTFVGAPVDKRGVLLWDKLWDKFPEMKAEFKDLKVLWHWIGMPNSLHTTKKKVRVPDDIRGMKILVGPAHAGLLLRAGANPVVTTMAEYYMVLERGLGEGVLTSYIIAQIVGFDKLTPYHLSIKTGAYAFSMIMNLDKWNSLPPDIQKIIDGLSPWATDLVWTAFVQSDAETERKWRELGHTVVDPTPEELRLWLDLGLSEAQEWIKKIESPVKPARAVFEEAVGLSKEYRSKGIQ